MSRDRDKSLRSAEPLPVVIPAEALWPWPSAAKAKQKAIGALVNSESGYLETVYKIERAEVTSKEAFREVFTPLQSAWFITLASLLDALTKGDDLAAETMFARLLVLHRDVEAKRPQFRSKDDPLVKVTHPEAQEILKSKPELSAVWVTQFLSKFLSRARFVYWVPVKSSKPQPAIYCPDLYMAYVVDLLLGRTLRICPHCGTTFKRRKNQPKDYCSLRCQGAHRQARHRRAKKEAKADVHL